MCVCVQSYEAPGNVQFTPNQLAYIWIAAGGNPQVVGIAVAIAMRESGGNSTATCVNGGSPCGCMGCIDRGLWQIDNRAWGDTMSTYDVMGNARAAVSIYNQQGWGPWGGAIAPINVTPDPNTPINATQGASNNGQGAGGVTTTDQQAQDVSFWGRAGQLYTHPWQIPGYLWDSGEQQLTKQLISVAYMILNPILNAAAGVMGIGAGATMFLFGLFMLISDAGDGSVGGGAGRLGEIAGAGTSAVGLVTGQPEIMAAGGAMAGAGSGLGAAARSKLQGQRRSETEQRQMRRDERVRLRQERQQASMMGRTQYQQEQLSARQTATAGARSDLAGQRHAESMTREGFRTEQFGVREELRQRSREFNRQQGGRGQQGPPNKPKGPSRQRDPKGRFV